MKYIDLSNDQLAYLLALYDSQVNNCEVDASQFADWTREDLLGNFEAQDEVDADDLTALQEAELLPVS